MLSSPLGSLIFSKLCQFPNTSLPIQVTVSGISISVKPQSQNAIEGIKVIVSGMVIVSSAMQPENTFSPKDVSDSGSTKLFTFSQPWNAEIPIVSTLLGILSLTIFEQPQNALSSMLLSPSDYSRLSKLTHSPNVQTPIVVTPPGIVIPLKLPQS